MRILETELGRLRAYIIVTEDAIRSASVGLSAADIGSFSKSLQELMGLLVYLFVKTPLSSEKVNLMISLIAQSIGEDRLSL